MTILITAALLAVAFTPKANAAATVTLYGYTDKVQYKPGDTVTVYFYIYNHGPDEVILRNVSVFYPWYSPIWDGNQSFLNIDKPRAKGTNWNKTVTFTIPTDGRWSLGNRIYFTYVYTIGATVYTVSDKYISIQITPEGSPSYQYLMDMDKLVNAFAILAVLVIVGAVIVAAAVLVSMRRPQVVWKKEE